MCIYISNSKSKYSILHLFIDQYIICSMNASPERESKISMHRVNQNNTTFRSMIISSLSLEQSHIGERERENEMSKQHAAADVNYKREPWNWTSVISIIEDVYLKVKKTMTENLVTFFFFQLNSVKPQFKLKSGIKKKRNFFSFSFVLSFG